MVDEAGAMTVEELTREQGVGPIEDARRLIGSPIDDFDEFLAAVLSVRGTA